MYLSFLFNIFDNILINSVYLYEYYMKGKNMKRQISISILAIVLVSAFLTEKAYAGAWTVPKHRVWGEYYMKWDYATSAFDSTTQRTGGGNQSTNFKSWEFVMEPKMEFGVTDWLTALGSVEWKEGHYKEYDRPVSWGPFTHKNHGITNVKVGGRLRMLQEPVVISTQTRVFIYPGYGIDHGDDPGFQNQPSIGYGDDAVEQRILIGKKFDMPIWRNYTLPCYVGAETGYRWRTKHVCNDIPYFVEGGFWPVPWFLLKSELDGYKVHGGTGSIKSGYGIWRIGGVWQVFGDSILREGDKMFNIEFQYGMTVFGKNTNDAQELVLKVQTQF